MSYPKVYEVMFNTPIIVMESRNGHKFLEGTLIHLDMPTQNNRVYRFEEAEKIAREAIGKPVRVGVDSKGLHIEDEDNTVGRVTDTIIDKGKKLVKGIIEVWNTKKFPNIVDEISKAWRFSVGGWIHGFQFVHESFGRFIRKCLGFDITNIQLLRPNEKAGDEKALIEVISDSPVGETISFSPNISVLFVDGNENIEVRGSGIREVSIS